ncbi:MAG: glucosamine-6-phosphate deaminase [Candidatus Omnitrophica bacterium]|nr:glucosamine-6-phosphate deaminase [Candidatus Omnitrophota bacterium]
MRNYDYSSNVEKVALKDSGFEFQYLPEEKIRILEVKDFPSLGKITALRFLEWCQKNPEGVISLPTGKTPEHFIYWTSYILENWDQIQIQQLLEKYGLDTFNKPDMSSFIFVQIDEFFPMNPKHENSFVWYIKNFYFKKFRLNEKKAILIDAWTTGCSEKTNLGELFPDGKVDLSLRFRQPLNRREELQQKALLAADAYAMEYEKKIREYGGIGFFLGGIGPDGHIGFNIKGSDHFSTTRLAPINYETAAAAAVDLGGIEISRGKIVMTIGLQTITYNPTATAIIIAAGEGKAKIIRDAVTNEESLLHPATALQKLKGACFYLTSGTTILLAQRTKEKLRRKASLSEVDLKKIIIDVAVKNNKTIDTLQKSDFEKDTIGNFLLSKGIDIKDVSARVSKSLMEKIRKGTQPIENTVFLHTGPHHDDIMLGYMPYIIHLVRTPLNSHYFATLTSGFTSVTNDYVVDQLKNLENFLTSEAFGNLIEQEYFNPENKTTRIRDVYLYLDGVAANDSETQNEASARRMMRNIVSLVDSYNISTIKRKISWFFNYFATAYPGKKDVYEVQLLKGMIREWEEELLWGHLGFNCEHIFHMRLPFYTGDIFTRQPELKEDVMPILSLIEKIKPDIISVAMDPEASGPDTHYKVLQAVATALAIYLEKNPERKIRIWGYRNVWYRFHPAEADIIVPVSMNSFAIMRSAFNICFGSQRSASFPSYEYDGPFCDLAQKIMVEQYSILKTCLGRNFFYSSDIPRLRATRGIVFLKDMSAEEFFEQARVMKSITESNL